jgi:serine protease Do
MEIYNCRQRKAVAPFVFVPALASVLLLACPLPARGETHSNVDALRQIGKTFAQIAEKAAPAVVRIEAERRVALNRSRPWKWPSSQPFGFNFGQPFGRDDNYYYFFPPHEPWPDMPKPGSRQRSVGCGFIVSEDGYILTNEHVVHEARNVSVKLADKREFEAEIVGTDPATDIAVLKIEAANLPVLPLGDSDALEVGEWVVAVSSPWVAGHPFAAGMVTAKGKSGFGMVDYENFIQTDAAITIGQGGGPLLNLDGKVVGINTAIVDEGRRGRISLAIPINMAKAIYEQLIDSGTVDRGFLGVSIQDVDRDMAAALGLKEARGAVVAHVMEDSAAEKAGVKAHDVIIELNGEPVQSASELRHRIALLKPGTQVELTVLRNEERKSFTATLGKRSAAEQTIVVSPGVRRRLGFSVQDLTAELAEHLGYQGETGVVVTEVEADSEAARKGLKAGALIFEVNRQPVKNVRDFNRAIEQGRRKGSVLLLVKDKQRTRFVLLRLR